MKVSEVAKLASVTVRTLHHYDEIGLVVPGGRTEAGYRLYTRADVERLREVLLFRRLGFPLSEIAGLMGQDVEERRAALRAQRARLVAQAREGEAVIRALDALLEGDEDMKLDGMDEYAEEARERWGDTEAYRESARRVKGYSKADWARLQAESGETLEKLKALMAAGEPADGPAAMDAAEEARLHIDRWFYPCSREMHVLLGEGYVADPRFTAFYDRVRPGMAAFLCTAIKANAARGG